MPRSVYNAGLWKRMRPFILRRDQFICYWCGGVARTVDHRLSVAEGGHPFAPDNLVAACRPCNSARGAEVTKAKARGTVLGVRRRLGDVVAPADEPVVVPGAIRV